MSSNLFELFRNKYLTNPDKIFLELPDGRSYSFAAIDDLSARMATMLTSEGFKVGDRLVAQVDKTPAAVTLYLAVLRTGGIFVPLNTAYTASEVEYFLGDASPRLFFCRAEAHEELKDIAKAKGVTKSLILGNTEEQGFWKDSLSAVPSDKIEPREEEDLASFLYTSGTTGRSKGAMLSHGNLASNAQTLHQLWQFEPEDVLLHALPIFHIHGLFVALHCALLNASKVLFLPSFNLTDVLDGMRGEATVLMGVPTFYTRLLDSPNFQSEDCAGMRLFISGSAPMTEQVHKSWTDKTGHKILERYGMTEAGMITSNPYEGERVPGTVGFALPGVEVRIADKQGTEVESGSIGCIEARGPNIFQGYWQMPEKTVEEFREDGFFITGDLGVMDEDGRVSIVGRDKDLIISGGYNIYPKEIESILDEHHAVLESAVVGIPHRDFGESVVAAVVAEKGQSPSEQELKDFLSDKLARFKQPRHIFVLEELPRNTMGKVQKNLLREQFSSNSESS
jgi:malonyl-CoA/methylmalonyl-CoA synthetase